jgi:hypothetical protein
MQYTGMPQCVALDSRITQQLCSEQECILVSIPFLLFKIYNAEVESRHLTKGPNDAKSVSS